LGVIFALGSATAQAAPIFVNPEPLLSGNVSGIELCPQFICGVAVFTMGYQGKIGIFPNAGGIITTALNHGDLPTPDNNYIAPIYRGKWELQSLFAHIKGDIVRGKITLIDPLDPKKFHISAELSVTPGGPATLLFYGTLDHTPTIPTIKGSILPLIP
jgi:hypothetical protein